MFSLRRACLVVLGSLIAWAVSAPAQPAAKKPGDYQVGDVALTDISTPVELVVVDREASAALREKEALKLPAFARFDPRSAEAAVGRFRLAMAGARELLLGEVEAQFGARQLEETRLREAGYRKFRTEALAVSRAVPLTGALLDQWVTGQTNGLEQQLSARLQEAMTARRIRGDDLPEEIRNGPASVRLLTLTAGEPAPALADAEKNTTAVPRASLVALTKVRTDLQRALTGAEKPYARFLAGFVQPNCHFDLELTRRYRAARTESIWTADRYAAGTVLVRAGEPVTHRIKAALDELAAQTAVTELRRAPWQPAKYWPLLVISVSTGLLVAGLVVWFLIRRLEPRMDAVIVQTAAMLPAGGARALLGSSAEDSLALRPHLENALKDKLVTELLTQRKDLIETQRQAEADLATLEHRLTELHAPFQARLDAYERRIAELEQDLAARGDENKELINATILLMKQKLESEKSGSRLKLN